MVGVNPVARAQIGVAVNRAAGATFRVDGDLSAAWLRTNQTQKQNGGWEASRRLS
jgi:hypothetical protein